MSKKQRQATSEDMSWELESTLEPGMLRFIAHVMENGLNVGLRSEHDFIRHFSPRDIMTGLADRPDLRANILVSATGIRAKIAAKKAAESAGEDLQIALDEGETTAELIVSLFHPDDRVRYLDRARLWSYITEPRFWKAERKQNAEFERAKTHISFILDRAIEERLLTQRDIVEGLTVANLVQSLPLSDLTSVLEAALKNSHSGKPFTDSDFLNVVPTQQLVEKLPLSLIWESVIEPLVAVRNSLSSGRNDDRLRTAEVETLIGVPGDAEASDSDSNTKDASSSEDWVEETYTYSRDPQGESNS